MVCRQAAVRATQADVDAQHVAYNVSLVSLVPLMDLGGDSVSGLYALSAGYLLVSLFWSASMLFMIEREYAKVRRDHCAMVCVCL